MASKSSIEREKHISALVKRERDKRQKLKEIVMDQTLDPVERFRAQMKLASLPRNGSATRGRNRCEITGRSRGVYRKFRLSRIMFREMASNGLIPGIQKASW